MKPLAARACARPLTAPSTMTLLGQPHHARCAINGPIHRSIMERARSRSSAGYRPATLALHSLVGSLAARPIASVGPVPELNYRAYRVAGERGGSGAVFHSGFVLFGLPFHRADRPIRLGRLRFVGLVDLLRALAREFKDPQLFITGLSISKAPLQASTSSSWARSGKPFENAKQLLVPGPALDFHVAGAALRAERPEPRELVAALRGRGDGEATQRAHQVQRLALAGLSRILAEPDVHPLAVLCGGVQQKSLDIARVGPVAHRIEKPVAAVVIAPELDPDGPVGSLNSVFSVAARSQ